MKVSSKPFIYSGTCDGLVYYYNKRLDSMIARRYVYPRHSSQNRTIGAISKNLAALNVSAGFKDDLDNYVALFYFAGGQKKLLHWRNAFLTIMFAMAKKLPSVNLLTLTRAQIFDEDLPCKTVKDAIEAGLLEPVSGYERFTAEI